MSSSMAETTTTSTTTTALGKRKERSEGDTKTHGSTLFISNLPYTATSTDLQTLFSDIAPVRSAFVVLDHDTGVSKGVGYVSFAIREDAEEAVDKVQGSGEGLVLVGRKLRVEWADNKPKEGESLPPRKKVSKVVHPQAQKQQKPKHTPSDALSIRTIVVSGLPSTGIDQKILWKKMRKLEGAKEVLWPVGEDSTTAHVTFSTPHTASSAISKLHAHVFKGSLLSVTLKKRLETLSKSSIPNPSKSSSAIPTKTAGTTSTKTGNAGGAAPNRNSRLIIRNLPFEATEQDLRSLFLPYGPIHSIHIPLSTSPSSPSVPAPTPAPAPTSNPSTSDAPADADADEAIPAEQKEPEEQRKNKGFAFIWMLSKKDAERAMEGVNGRVVRAGMARELVEGKQKRKKDLRVERKAKAAKLQSKNVDGDEDGGEGDAGEGEQEGKDGEEKEGGEVDRGERIVAVDWALSKDRWEEERKKMKEEDEQASSGSSEDEDEDDEDGGLGVHSGSGSDADSDDAEGDEEDVEEEGEEEPVKPTLPPPESGTTLFIRNIPYEATEDELRVLFRAFGPLRYARITLDHSTGRSRGTGFACFWNLEDADKVIAQSDLLRSDLLLQDPNSTTSKNTKPKANPFKLPSILTPDPTSTLAANLVLHGRTLDVVRAVTRDEAGRLKEEGERRREKADKRNTYLLREGLILPSSPSALASNLSPADLEKRAASYGARKALLKTNPALYISKTRLSVRGLPGWVTERMMRKMANWGVKEFEREVREGRRGALGRDELVVDEEEDEEPELDGKKEKGKKGGKFGNKKGGRGVKQAKVIRTADRIDPLTLKGKSKGYGFIEMFTHADALRVLRWANNNEDVNGLWEGWWREEVEGLIKEVKGRLKDDAKAGEKGGGEGDGDKEKDKERLRKLEEELKREGKKGTGEKGKTLIVEFSIENVGVVKKRNERMGAGQAREDKDKDKAGKNKNRKRPVDARDAEEAEAGGGRPSKKRKTDREADPTKSSSSSKKASDSKDNGDGETKEGQKPNAVPKVNPLGSIIGRKRKERAVKRGGGGKGKG